MAEPKGNVVLLVGPSCAGKSTLANAVQQLSSQPYLVQSLDSLFGAVPERWGSSGEHALDGFRYDWRSAQIEGAAPCRQVAYGPIGWNILRGFHRSVAAYANTGINVIVDDMLLDLEVMIDWAGALETVRTLLVSVTAPKEELLRREAAREVHPTPGLVAGHFELHRGILADIRIDTSGVSPLEAARSIIDLTSSSTRLAALHAFRRA